jgi:Icc-related predicted phosphoesterase
MKIHYVSDLHLDVSGFLDLPGGDVLILAGDLCEAKALRKEFHQTKVVDREPGEFPCYDFFHSVVPKYKKVFMIMGNHEHYHGKFWKTKTELMSMMPANVTLLENECEEYEGVLFVGATLWTDMNKADPLTMSAIANYMNDYKVITYQYPEYNAYHKMRPSDTVKMHFKSKQYIEETVQQHKDKPVVVITHMAPTFESVNEKYKGETMSNGAYCSDLSNLILDNENIRVWVHGHVHDPVDYMVGWCRVVCNPRGYLPWEGDNGFQPEQHFEVDNGILI